MRHLMILAAAVGIAGCGGSPSGPDDVKSVIVVGTPPAVGVSTQFTALAVHSNGSSETATTQATWKSSNTAVATVNGDVTVTGVSRGSVEISATISGTRGALTFDIADAPSFKVSGVVTESGTGNRLVGATVVAKDSTGASKSAVTDGNGAYAITGVAAGALDVTARADGFAVSTTSTRLLGDLTLTFTLSRAAACPVLGFDDLGPHGAPLTTSTACGFTIRATTSNWTVSTSYGHPAPFVQFMSQAGSTTAGEILVTAVGGGRFRFQSVDVYSSTTPIPYAITGIASGATAFVLQNTVGNTFGNFATVTNPQAAVSIDALLIHVSNPAATCCSNPMGVDNIVLAR
jgi:hypothetical protein